MEAEIVAIASLVGGLFKSIAFVQEGELGIKLRFGKAVRDKNDVPVVYRPGFLFMIPFVETLKRRHVRQETINMGAQKLTIQGGLVYEVDAVIIFKTRDVYKALFEIETLEQSVSDIGQSILRSTFEVVEPNFNLLQISENLKRDLAEKVSAWGVDIITFTVTQSTPYGSTENVIGLPAMLNMRVKALAEVGVDCFQNPVLAAVLLGNNIALYTDSTPVETQKKEPIELEK